MKKYILFLVISFIFSHSIIFSQAPGEAQQKEAKEKQAKAAVPTTPATPDISKMNVDQYQAAAQKLVGVKPNLTLKDLGIQISKLGIPKGPLDQLENIGIKYPQISGAPRGFQGVTVTGKLVFGGSEVDVTLIVVKKREGGLGYAVGVQLPPNWKMSNFSSALAKLDSLTLPSGKFIVSNFDYQDPKLPGVFIKQGVNFVSDIKLTGPFSLIGNLINNKAKFKGALILEGGDFFFVGQIPSNISQSSFAAVIPLKMGVDLTKIAKIPKSVTKIIEGIYTEPFSFSVNPTGEIGMKSGFDIKLGTQETPLRFVASGLLQPKKVRLTGGLESPLELKWLALDNVVFQMDIDEVVTSALAALGIPFSGLAMKGGLSLGPKGDKRATVSMASSIGLSADGKIGDLLWQGSAQNLRISDFVYYLTKLAKKSIPTEKMPSLALDEVTLQASPTQMTIGETTYQPGVYVAAKITVAGAKGNLDFRVDPAQLSIQGGGGISQIKTPYFVFTGPGKDNVYGTPDDGALVDMMLSVKAPQTSYMTVKGKLDLPTLNIGEETNLTIGATKIDTSFVTKIANLFTGEFKFGFEATKPEGFSFAYDFKQDFLPLLTQALNDEVQKLRNTALAQVQNLDGQIKSLQGQLDGLNKQAQAGISSELKKTDEKIAKLKSDISKLRSEYNKKCKGIAAVKNAKRCTELSVQIPKKGTELAAQLTYREGLLKPGKKVVAGLTTQINEAAGKLAQSKALQITAKAALDALVKVTNVLNQAAKTIRPKEIGGSWSGEKAKKGISPQVTVVVEMDIPGIGKKTLSVKNAEFNFKNPKQSIVPIAKKLLDVIKGLVK